ncbi:PAAR domain-containing protein [Chromobacterium sp. IIBBL 290-4]|uniref:PAAR domain-containing protein n=1 Tax=Chromobacterium sp. IIBBL 290-4 TaxID=2953890 RepID=UPI0020B6E71C|nr:PAAR domain-containing protein [Chromobacterium sp. IIBBL 290-4]UTH73983.1 PAAR domain-containing protein [Chromobacterium sp. IIBBL 290-4]
MKPVIRLGDPTSHGGKVVSASSTTTMFGKAVALVGDSVTCPQQGHTNCVIVEGDPTWTVGGKGVALDGHAVSCGAKLISTLGSVMRSYEGSGTATTGAGADVAAVAAAAAAAVALMFNDKYQLRDEDGQPLKNAEYTIIRADGSQESGKTDGSGHTHMLDDHKAAEIVAIHIGDFDD